MSAQNKTARMAIAAALLVAASATVTLAIERELKHAEGDSSHELEEPDAATHEASGPDRVTFTKAMLEHAGIELGTAGPGSVSVVLALPGEVALNAERMAHVTPRVGGTVRDVKRQLGEQVAKGDVLAILDSKELAEMQRDVAAFKERLSLAEANHRRAATLWTENISSERDYLAAKQALAEAQIETRSAERKLAASAGAAGTNGGYSLLAPLTGTIIEKHISVGEVLRDDTQTFLIADLSLLWVQVTVYARDLARVQTGQSVRVVGEGIAEPALGAVSYLGQVVGEETRTATARIELASPGPMWRPGLFVTAHVAVDEAPFPVVVPDAAVQRYEGGDVVFVAEGDTFEARPVEIGSRGVSPGGVSVVALSSGLRAGEQYVAKNSFIVKADLAKGEAGHEH